MIKCIRWLNDKVSQLSWQLAAASLLFGFAIGFFVYILYLQTPVFSVRYLLLGIAIAMAVSLLGYFLFKKHPFASKNGFFITRPSFLLACLLFLLALPSYILLPPYPELPFFQRESTLVISVETGAESLAWSGFRRIYLNTGAEKLGFRSFLISGPWIPHGDDFILQPESVAQIIWQGRVGQRASLALPIPSDQLMVTTNWDNEIRKVSVEKSPYVQHRNFIAPLWYIGLIYAVAWIPLFFSIMLMDGFSWIRRMALPALIVIFSFLQVDLQFQRLADEFHRPLQDAIETVQLARHAAVLNGSAPNPWQYRVLSEWILESFFFISSRILRLENSVFISLFTLRALQNIILLTLAYMFFLRLGITKTIAIYGVFLFAGGMLHSFYQSDLSFNIYFDVIFFLLGGILILDARYEWVPILMLPAALNRETSVLIPILLIAWGWRMPQGQTRTMVFGALGLLVWGLIFVAMHLYYPNAPIYKVGDELLPGWGLFRYNLTIPEMPLLLFQTLGFLPLLGLLTHRDWHPLVRIGFLLLVPAWLLVHAFSSIWSETRLFLVLSAMVFVPAILPIVGRRLQDIRQTVLSQSKVMRSRGNDPDPRVMAAE